MNKSTRISFNYSFLLLLALLLGACSQTKNTVMHRGWHNMNARFNGYFYSRENVKESLKKVNKAKKDDFSRIIPLFVYTDNTNAKTYYGDFDKTIKKSSVVIQRHTIMNKRTKKEIPNACRWIDENYMLIGQAHFYKRDLFSALEAFEYVSKIYPNPKAKYSAILWMIRTQNEIGSYSQSELLIDEIRTADDFPKEKAFEREFSLVQADFHIKRGDYTPAVKHLTRGIALTKKKKERARYLYVLAQLYQKLGDNSKASQYFAMVPGLHPYYDMEFNAQINRAKLYDISSGGSKAIKKKLMRMLRDDKNVEFQDQIYYALAEIATKENDTPLAINYLNKSIKASVNNNTQKALSYLRRADIYFDQTEYTIAQANYDSTMTFLPKDYVDYKIIEEKKKSLTSLVTNLEIITLEDSLQNLAGMSVNERNAFIDKLISRVEDEERKQEEARLLAQENQAFLNTNTQPTVVDPGAGALWYFYNQTTISFGIGEFSKKWGSRKLEDNWRRSEKDQVLANNLIDENGEPLDSLSNDSTAIAQLKNSKNKKDRAYYLKSIPLTPDALAKSHQREVEAFYNVGSIYKEELLNNKKSVEAFEELLKRYPENKYKLSTYYQLYRTYLAMNNQSRSDYYKNIILNDYPTSEYALLIKNPGHAGDIAASKSEVEKFYSETYQYYSEGNYQQALANATRADSLYSKSYLMPQFAFVKALAIGRTQDINAFEIALTQVVLKYPKEPVKARAQEMLDMIRKQKNPEQVAPSDSVVAAPPSKFKFNEDGDYFWVAIVANGKGDIAKFKTALSTENAASFGTKPLDISSVFLDLTHQLVSVKTFTGKDEAMNYYQFMKSNKSIYKDLEEGAYQSFIISAENYTIFYKEKNIEEYKTFFTQNFRTN
ncbi:MAG: tetratricopeptide repeat protein [Bacteroidota bacterium]|nr:tetratricopeptide repeat protein [Bacteroidota bacterium]